MDQQQAIAQLLSYRTLAGFESRDFEPILSACTIREMVPGEQLFAINDELDEGYILLQGRLEEISEPRPGRRLARHHYVPGRLVAPNALIKTWPTRTQCGALEASAVLVIPRNAFIALLSAGNTVVLRLIDVLLDDFVEQVRDSNRRLDEIHSRPHETLQQLRQLADSSAE